MVDTWALACIVVMSCDATIMNFEPAFLQPDMSALYSQAFMGTAENVGTANQIGEHLIFYIGHMIGNSGGKTVQCSHTAHNVSISSVKEFLFNKIRTRRDSRPRCAPCL